MHRKNKIRLLIPLLCLLLTQTLEAQSIPGMVNKFWNEKTSIDSIHSYFKITNRASTNIKRTIDANQSQLLIEHHSREASYNILIQGDVNNIYLAVVNIEVERANMTTKNVLFNVDSVKLQKFLSLHDVLYHTTTSIETYKKFVLNRYGRGCGFAGIPSPKYLAMTSLSSGTNPEPLRKWLNDPDYETKVLGATGLLILQQKGVKLINSDLTIIAHLKMLNVPINYCSGCTDWGPHSSAMLLSDKTISYLEEFTPGWKTRKKG